MSSDWITLCVVAFACVVAVDAVRRHHKKDRSLPPYPLPPGPTPLPIIGNIHNVNISAPWLTYAEWSKVYGDLVYSRFFNQDVIIINSEKIAKALLEDRSSNYADRPHLITNTLFGIDFNTALMPYGGRWRLQRRFFHQTFKAESASRFVPMQQRRIHLLAHRLLESPERVFEHIHEFTTSVIINAIYDYDPVSPDDPMVDIIGRVCRLIAAVNTPEAAGILGAFPIILSIPSWFPGMSIKRKAALARTWARDWVEIPFEHALRKQNEGSTSPAMVFDGFREEDKMGGGTARLQALKDAAATGFLAGSETSGAALMTFVLAMVLHPAIQDKAYAEIDAVVGKERLPTFDDRPSLPYIDAIIRETLRWNPVVPLSVPHAVVKDDVYDGYHIPKGATVMTNLWSMAHNEFKYPKPFEFIPERFLHSDGTLTSDNVQNIAFGFGRRSCVGRAFADVSMWYAVATILALWRMSFPKDELGNDVPCEPKWASGMTTYPLPFPCRFEPRMPGMDAKKLEELTHATSVAV
ncbi:cytochrome P450 [Boletus edulis]|nr:cytochrome P450 [Boletus edulis]